MSSLLKTEPTSFLTSSEEKKNPWKFSELILLLPTSLFCLSDRHYRWQVTTLSFVFKALIVHWFYLRHWIYRKIMSFNIARVTTDPSPSLSSLIMIKPPMLRAPPCWQNWEQGLYRPALPADGVFYIWRNRGQLEWLCKVGMSDLDPRRRGGKSQGLALFQLRSESLHLSCKAFLWEGEKKGEVFIQGDWMLLQHFQ